MKAIPEEETDDITDHDVWGFEVWIDVAADGEESDQGDKSYEKKGPERDLQRSKTRQLYQQEHDEIAQYTCERERVEHVTEEENRGDLVRSAVAQ